MEKFDRCPKCYSDFDGLEIYECPHCFERYCKKCNIGRSTAVHNNCTGTSNPYKIPKVVGVVDNSTTIKISSSNSGDGLGWRRFKRSIIWAVATIIIVIIMENEGGWSEESFLGITLIGFGVSAIYFLGIITSWFR